MNQPEPGGERRKQWFVCRKNMKNKRLYYEDKVAVCLTFERISREYPDEVVEKGEILVEVQCPFLELNKNSLPVSICTNRIERSLHDDADRESCFYFRHCGIERFIEG